MNHPSIARASSRAPRVALIAAALVAALACLLVAVVAPPARADGPGEGTPWVASLGDSYISGEAGRWAGNTNEESSWIDALGKTAYFDNAGHTAETIPGCHRSQAAEVYIGGSVNGVNLACSGAKTSSFTSEEVFKPGIDFYNTGGHEGQALLLQNYAKAHNVTLVLLSIGGNNFNFAGIVQNCIEDFLTTPEWFPTYCSHEKSTTETFGAKNVATQKAAIKGAVQNVATAMTNAGYKSTQYTILVQDYPSPIPNGSGFRYEQSGFKRQTTGGCGFWNEDANYANSTMLPTIDKTVFGAAEEAGLTNVKTMELSSAFNGRRLCEKGVGLLEEQGLKSWTGTNAVDKTEWINQVRTITGLFPPYEIQEDLHPNYWAQLALRNCVTQAYNAGTPKGGTCAISGTGLNGSGQPKMLLK